MGKDRSSYMLSTRADIIRQLHMDILPLQGFKPPAPGSVVDMGLGPIAAAFPSAIFPTGAIHEFAGATHEEAAAAGGFLAALLAPLMRGDRACIWISAARTLFPPALKAFGVDAERIIFIDLQRERDVLWCMEESLKCEGLGAVVGEMREVSFTASRRLQLAVEQSRVTGFLLRQQPRNGTTSACVARWKIGPLPSVADDGLPGVGAPRWQVELVRVRNGKPGAWAVEWTAGRFLVQPGAVDAPEQEERAMDAQKRKTG